LGYQIDAGEKTSVNKEKKKRAERTNERQKSGLRFLKSGVADRGASKEASVARHANTEKNKKKGGSVEKKARKVRGM